MTAYIVQVSQGDTPAGSIGYQTIFAVGLCLFAMTLGMNVLARRSSRGIGRCISEPPPGDAAMGRPRVRNSLLCLGATALAVVFLDLRLLCWPGSRDGASRLDLGLALELSVALSGESGNPGCARRDALGGRIHRPFLHSDRRRRGDLP